MKFRKKPVVIEARQLTPYSIFDIKRWVGNAATIVQPGNKDLSGCCLTIETKEGVMEANNDDWIICGVAGEFYPCKPDIFIKTYEPV